MGRWYVGLLVLELIRPWPCVMLFRTIQAVTGTKDRQLQHCNADAGNHLHVLAFSDCPYGTGETYPVHGQTSTLFFIGSSHLVTLGRSGALLLFRRDYRNRTGDTRAESLLFNMWKETQDLPSEDKISMVPLTLHLEMAHICPVLQDAFLQPGLACLSDGDNHLYPTPLFTTTAAHTVLTTPQYV